MIFYYKLNDLFWVKYCSTNKRFESDAMAAPDVKGIGLGLTVVRSTTLPSVLIDKLRSRRASVFQTEKFFAVSEYPTNPLVRKNKEITFIADCKYLAEYFRRTTKQELLEALCRVFDNPMTVIRSISKFVFVNDFSLWGYNQRTKTFTNILSSFTPDVSYITMGDFTDNSLINFYESNLQHVCTAIDPKQPNAGQLKTAKSVNRFRINISTALRKEPFVAVLSLYSKHADYTIKKEIIGIVLHIAEAVLSRFYNNILYDYNQLLNRLQIQKSDFEFRNFIRGFFYELVVSMHFEAGSFMLYNNKKHCLEVIASFQNGQPVELEEEVRYELGNKSLTYGVFRDRKFRWSYDICQDPENSNTFNEATVTHPRDWVAFPLIERNENQCFGVLRLKNKDGPFGSKYFTQVDVEFIEMVLRSVESLYSREKELMRRKREVTERENRINELRDFIKTYRHEIKSPLTVITRASSSIRRSLLRDRFINEPGDLPKRVREVFDDLDRVGDRLSFIANILTTDAKELVNHELFMEANVFKEIVAPVSSFRTVDAKEQGIIVKIFKDSLLSGVPEVFCDPQSAGLAFHCLLDNAIKYAQRPSVIRVMGISRGDFSKILIENEGLAIHEDEADRIFEKYTRGKEPEANHIHGAGIGLHLAREIAKENGGDLVLESRSNPVRFSMSLKHYKRI